jgi:purine-binding chemotaxis protein CheW
LTVDLLEIRKKAKKQKVADQEQAKPTPAAEPIVELPPEIPQPPQAEAKPAPPAPKPQPAPRSQVAPEISPESFEAFFQSTAKPSSPVAPPVAATPLELDLGGMAKAFGEEPAEKVQGLDSLFLDLAAEELYRHSYLADGVIEEGEQREVLSCMLASEQYGIDIHRIKEIIKMREITEVPRAPAFIPGIITLRGRVIPVFDLRERLGLEKADLGRESKIVVVHHREELYGLIVDAVIDVSRFPESSVESTPPVMASVEAKYLEGIGRTGDQMIILLDLDEVLSLEAASAA